nr:odorant receptor 13a-like [Megalopta genalis]
MRAEETNDFSLFVTSFYLKLTGIWSAASPEEERQRWNAFIFTMTFMFLGAYTELRELYYAWGNSFEIFVLVAYGIGYLCVDNFMCIANFHAATQFRILQYRITSIREGHKMEKHSETTISRLVPGYYADDCYVIFKDCIKQHQSLIAYCEKVEEVFTLIVLGQVLLFSILICLDGYLMLLEEASFYRRMVFTFHLIGCISQLLMFTYSCDCVLRESMEIAESVYDTQWTILPLNTGGKMLRTDLQLVMLRSRMPCCLTAGGFFMVSLETYTKVLSTAASYFTLLRQY